MRFAVFAICCHIRNCYRLHIACDMVLQYGVAIWCCDLLCDLLCNLVRYFYLWKTDTDAESHTKLQIHYIASAIFCIHQITSAIWCKKNDSNRFLSDTKSQIHQIVYAICSKSHALNRWCNQPFNNNTSGIPTFLTTLCSIVSSTSLFCSLVGHDVSQQLHIHADNDMRSQLDCRNVISFADVQ
jgi:hypothetical protein